MINNKKSFFHYFGLVHTNTGNLHIGILSIHNEYTIMALRHCCPCLVLQLLANFELSGGFFTTPIV